MSELTLEIGSETKSVPVPPRPIQAGAPLPNPRATPDPEKEYFRPFGNYQQNSRSGQKLPLGKWSVRWKGELDPAVPLHVVEADGRFLVQSEVWRLFDRQGGFVAKNPVSSAPIVTDSPNRLLYSIDGNGYITAHNLDDGKLLFRTLPAYGEQYSRVHLARNGNRMLVVGTERDLDPHGEHPPTKSLVEVRDLGTPPVPDYMGFLSSAVPLGTLYIPHPHVVAASSDDTIVAARPDRVYVLDWKLAVRAALEGTFEPRSISLDEAGNIYLLTGPEGAASTLLVLQQNGTRNFSFELPAGVVAKPIPPIVGYDHTVYLLTSNRIYAVGDNGKSRWTASVSGGIAGAVITADDYLVVTEGTEVAAYDAKGERTLLFRGEQFLTPPIISAWGEILVASKSSLFCFWAK